MQCIQARRGAIRLARARLPVGALDGDAAVKAAGAEQRRVEHVGAGGGGDADDQCLLLLGGNFHTAGVYF